jgi:hypothetical protein
MKKITLCILLNSFILSHAQINKGISGDSNWIKSWTNFKAKTTDYNEASNILAGVINQNTTLYKKNIYLLTGNVYVTNGATLTIEPGTVIRGDFESKGALIITKGSKIIAKGEETNPIVFTTNKNGAERKAGDWGGLIIFGEAPVNRFGSSGQLDLNLEPQYNVYGGENKYSDSGVLNYVRIEFAGKKLSAGKEFNGLSLAGIGSNTKLDFVQVSYSSEDSFEIFGGNLNLNHFISFRANDDDYDFTEGSQCNISNSIAVRNPFVSSAGKPRCFEIESYDVASNADLTKGITTVIANNITLLNEENENAGLTREAIYVREKSTLKISNSVISGFNQCVLLDGKIKTNFDTLDKIKIENMLFNNCNGYIESEIPENNPTLKNYYTNDLFFIECSKTKNTDLFVENDFKKTPDYRIKNNNILTSRLASN